jgi:hypothetical protein
MWKEYVVTISRNFVHVVLSPYIINDAQILSISTFFSHIFWRIKPLLGNDLETKNETTAVAMQLIGKHISTTMDLLLETVFSIFGPC